MAINGYEVSFGKKPKRWKCLKINHGDDHTTLQIFVSHFILDFKWLDCVICELYLNKAVKKIRRKTISHCLSLFQLP